MKHNRAIPALIVLALAVNLAGCAGDKLRNGGYKALGIYAIALEGAADIAENPATPTSVVDEIKKAKDVASPAVKALHADLVTYADLADQIKAIEAAGGTADIAITQKLQAALAALQKSFNETLPLITQLQTIVNGGH